MTTSSTRRRISARLARATAFGLLAFAAVLCQSQEAAAQWTTSGANTTTTNNVGIGTTAPSTSLHVSTASTAIPRGVTSEQTSADNNAAMFVLRKSRAGAAALNGDNIGNLYAEAFDGANFVSGGRVRFAIDGPVAAGSVPTALQFFTGTGGNGGVERMRVTSAGNVGIGTTAPNYSLVVGPALPSGFVFASMTVSRGPIASSSIIVGESGSALAEVGWDNPNRRAFLNAAGSTPIAVTQNGTNVRMFVTSAGDIGMGTTAPAAKLHVAGDIRVDGNISAKYQDVAEWVPSRQRLAAATVVIVDSAAVNGVLASHSSYDTGVAGVVSPQPGLILGEGGEGKLMIATTGRVKVKVDATRAPIRAGDLLVTSDVPGVAMRSEPVSFGGVAMHRPGTIIGKALESLEKGTGEILVLLSLQ